MHSAAPPHNSRLAIYAFLAQRRPQSYLGKIMLVAFMGTHIPLLTLFFYAIATTDLPAATKTQILLVALVATLVGTGITLYLLRGLLAPITLTFQSLRGYLEQQVKPQLPTHFTDEAGILMADTLYTIDRLDQTIKQSRHYDPLTTLPNRTFLQSQLAQQLQVAVQQQSALAVMMLDLDNFANLNNHLGQPSGDLLLRQAAQRLAALVPPGNVLARSGGDEFTILYAGNPSLQELITQSTKVLATLNQPFVVGQQEHYLTASIGIATYPASGDAANTLLTNADTALRVAKQHNRNGVQFYSAAMNAALQRRLELERDLRSALEAEAFTLFYQPQVDFSTGQITGAEALLRWFHPQLGSIAPNELIPIAEESGLILGLGEWVLREACCQNVAWQASGLPPIRMAVNLSAIQFQQADLIETVANVLASTKLAPAGLELEITEGLLMANVEQATATLQAFNRLGTLIALDDFGTGYSSLSYLKRFPLHYLKIDRCFVQGIPADHNDAAIVRAIVALAQSLQLAVIAEGVETRQQASCLQQLGCSTFQGYYFSRPVPAAEFTTLLQQTDAGSATWHQQCESSQRTQPYRPPQWLPTSVAAATPMLTISQ